MSQPLPPFPLPLPPASEAAALLARVDWARTPLGPVERWPHALRTAVVVALGSRFPMGVLWGEHYVQLYNDAYVPILGRKHPAAMGQSARDCWPELWGSIGPMFDSVRQTGQALWFEDLRMDIDRRGSPEEGYFTFSYSPILGEGHRVEGLFVSALETTERVLDARRQHSLREMAKAAIDGRYAEELLRRCMVPLAANPNDLPSAAVYLCAPGAKQARRVAGHGALQEDCAFAVLELDEGSALGAKHAQGGVLPLPPGAPGPETRVLPLRRAEREPLMGLLLVQPSATCRLDEAYLRYLAQVAEHLGAALARVEAFEQARRQRIDVLERMTGGFYAFDLEWRITDMNAASERFTKQCREQVLGRKLLEAFPQLEGSRFQREYERAMREQVPVHFEAYSQVGQTWVEVRAFPAPEGLSVFFQDVSERRSAQEAQRRLNEIIDATPDLVGVADPQGRTQFVNRAGRRMLGLGEHEDLTGRLLEEYVEPGSYACSIVPGIEAALREGAWQGESLLRRTDGQPLPVSQVMIAHRSPDGAVSFLSTIARDMTQARQAEQRLRESEERYRGVFEHSPMPMWMYDPVSLAFLEVNAAAVQHYGFSREEFLAMTLRDIRPPEEVTLLHESLARARSGHRFAGVFTHRRKDGRLLQVEVSVDGLTVGGRRVHLVVANDVTERRQLEAQLRQAQKMEAVGQLAGGIAHDFNNLLAVMGTYGRGALGAVPADSELHEDLTEVVSAVDRAAGLTRQLLAFSRSQSLVLEPLDLNEVVRDAERMLRRVIREDIQLVTRLAPGLEAVHADRGQLEQILLNLVVNARDAMPEGGTLTLQTAPHLLAPGERREQRCVRLEVRDTGCGMDERTRQRIFEPFFTTKPVGKGTGLGLSMVYGVLQQLGGHIEVESAPGQGATFTVLLPLSSERSEPVEAFAALQPLGSLRGSETVLVVEDEAAVRRSVGRLLRRQGYQVLEASHGQEALLVLETCGQPVHLVLTDLVMPVMGGRALAERLRARWPQLRVLFTSGYDPQATVGGDPVVAKPFAGDELLHQLRRALG